MCVRLVCGLLGIQRIALADRQLHFVGWKAPTCAGVLRGLHVLRALEVRRPQVDPVLLLCHVYGLVPVTKRLIHFVE